MGENPAKPGPIVWAEADDVLNIDESTLSIEEIREKLAGWLERRCKITPDVAMKYAVKQTPYLTCPAQDGKRLVPIACMFCHCGHMMECHYPKTCREAQCSHYRINQEVERIYG